MREAIDALLGFVLAVVLIYFAMGNRLIDNMLPHLFYERYVTPKPISKEQIASLGDEGYRRYRWSTYDNDAIKYDERIITGDNAEVLTYRTKDGYDLYTFVRHRSWIQGYLLYDLKFELVQFQNTDGWIDTIYFEPDID